MEFSRTVVVGFPGRGEEFCRDLDGTWARRALPASDFVQHCRPADFARTVSALLDQERELKLRRAGHTLDPTLNVVWLVQSTDPQLVAELGKLEAAVHSPPLLGQDIRVHIVLVLPDAVVGPVREREWDIVAANFEALAPNSNAWPPTRVYPLSLWSRAGLKLPQAADLFPWVQHFVEALVTNARPFRVSWVGREWVGLGIVRLEVRKPDPWDWLAILWGEIRTVRVAEGAPRPPWPKWDGIARLREAEPSLRPPPRPERTNCYEAPPWNVEAAWEAYRAICVRQCSRVSEDLRLPLDEEGALERQRESLLAGYQSFRLTVEEAERELRQVNSRIDQLRDLFDAAARLGGKRARLRRLQERQDGGRPVDERELERLRAEVKPVDEAIEAADLDFFLANDPQAQQALREAEQAHQAFEAILREWEERERKVQEEKKQKQGRLRRLGGFVLRALRVLPPAREEADEQVTTLCKRAWEQLVIAWEAQQKYQACFETYLDRWSELVLALACRDLLQKELAQARVTLERIERWQLPSPKKIRESSLVIAVARLTEPPLAELRRKAKELVQNGFWEWFWDGDVDGARQTLEEAVRSVAEELPLARISTYLDDKIWDAALVAAAPRALLQHRPEQRSYGFVLGGDNAPQWSERSDTGRWWAADEILLVRLVYPVGPSHLLEAGQGAEEQEDGETGAAPTQTPVREPPAREAVHAASPERPSSVVSRANPLVAEMLQSV